MILNIIGKVDIEIKDFARSFRSVNSLRRDIKDLSGALRKILVEDNV